MRELISQGKLSQFAASHPHLEIHVHRRNGQHPYIKGAYRTAAVTHQVSVKNYSIPEIENVMKMLRDRSGRKIKKLTKTVVTDTPSIQGVWTPFLNISEPLDIHIHGANDDSR